MKKLYQKRKAAKRRKQVLFLTGVAVVVTLMLMGISYAFLKVTLFGKEKIYITAGILAIDFKEENGINLENAYPISDSQGMQTSPYEFSVTNTGDINANYDIILDIEESKNMIDLQHIKYSIKSGEEEWSHPILLSDLSNLIIYSKQIQAGDKNNYAFRVWIDEATENEIQGKEFKAKIVVNATQENIDLIDKCNSVITLAGSLSMNVEQNSVFVDPGIEKIKDDQDTLEKADVKRSYEYYDGENTVEVPFVDTTKLGVYYIYYKINDHSGNEGVIVRSVNVHAVEEVAPPVITLKGNATEEIIESASYQDAGATATIDGEDRSDRIVTVGAVNSEKPGTYTIKYLITDNLGNTASVARSIIVKEKNKIVLVPINMTEGNHGWYKNVGIEAKVTGNLTIANMYYCTTTADKCEATTKATLSDNTTFDYSFVGNSNAQKVCFKVNVVIVIK